MSTNIYDIANELERAIRNLPEYKAVEAVKVSVEGNSEAKEILESYISFQKKSNLNCRLVKFLLKLTKRKCWISTRKFREIHF